MNRTQLQLLHENAKRASSCRMLRNLTRKNKRRNRIRIEQDILYKKYELYEKKVYGDISDDEDDEDDEDDDEKDDDEEDISRKNKYSNMWNNLRNKSHC
jgi:hypothetical protein